MSNRLGHLIVRIALKSATARRLVFQVLVAGSRSTSPADSTRPPGPVLWTRYGSRVKAWARSLDRASAPAVIHRPSDSAPREHRIGFDAEYDRMEKDEIYDRLETAETIPKETHDHSIGTTSGAIAGGDAFHTRTISRRE